MVQSIDPIHHKSSFRLAAEQIRRAIEIGTYLPGDRLPPSRQLAFQLGISVATLREAVRGLIDEGLLEMRRGPKGGLVVLAQPQNGRRRVSKTALAELDKLLELRKAIEAEAAYLAAERRTDADLKRLQKSYDAMTVEVAGSTEKTMRAARFNRADARFHADIARAARNDLFLPVIEDTRLAMFTTLGIYSGTVRPDVHAGHDEILREISRSRPKAAARAARRHIEMTRERARSNFSSRP